MPKKQIRRDWNKLEEEYILSDCKSISDFLKEKNIQDDGSVRKHTTGWNKKKREKQEKVKIKTIEKVIEKESTDEAKKKTTVNEVAELLLNKLVNISLNDIVEVRDIKTMTSSLKDLSEILNNNSSSDDLNTFANEIEKAWRNRNEH